MLCSGEEAGLLEGMLQLAEAIYKVGGFRQRVQVGPEFKEQLAIL